MANTTFTGPIRSEKGYQQISKNATTGAITVTSGDKWATEATASAGIEGTAAVYVTQVTRLKSDVDTNVNIVKSTIMIDLTGLKDGGTAGDIIGKDGGTANCNLGQITAALNGTIIAGHILCLETPAGGEPDIDVFSATVGTGAEDAAVSDLTETKLFDAGQDFIAGLSANQFNGGGFTALPAADEFLYLVGSGGGTDDTYTAGKFVITLYGQPA